MAKTGDLQEQRVGTTAKTEFGFVLYDKSRRVRVSFSYASLDAARHGKEHMDRALANITAEVWPEFAGN